MVKKDSSNRAIVAIIALIVIIAGLLIYFFGFRSTQDFIDSSPNPMIEKHDLNPGHPSTIRP